MHKYLMIVLCLGLIVGFGQAQDGEGVGTIQLSQFAISAEASSEYTNDGWSAMQATGEPDVEMCADNPNAWASLSYTSEEEILTLMYETPVQPAQVNIFQSYTPGGIVRVALLAAEDGTEIPLRNSADPGTPCMGIFSIDVPNGLPEVNGVVIYLDQSELGDWNEIDAVELVGSTTGEPADTEPSSIEIDAFPQYTVANAAPRPDNDAAPDREDSSTAAMPDFGGEWGAVVDCGGGQLIENGVGFTIVQQRSGSRYRVTAVGIGDFDPVLAVTDDYGGVICNDDASDASVYSANLPTTGQVTSSGRSSQVIFDNNSTNAFENVNIVVGGYQGQGGEFIVIVEGMIASSADGIGDPFSLYVSPALLMSGVDPTAYMIAVTQRFDPTILLIDGNYNTIEGDDKQPIGCDDAGTGSCWGESRSLNGAYVSRSNNRQLPGGTLDSMMTIPLDGTWGGYYNFAMTSFGGTYGDYIAAFHLGTAQQP